MIEGLAAELVVGRDPLDNVDIWRRCKQRAWWYGNRGGVSSFALVGDRHRALGPEGQAARRPRHTAPRRRPPRAAAGDREHASAAREPRGRGRPARRLRRELGFRGCKFGLGKRGEARLGSEVERDVEFMRLLRERIGPEPMLMWDRGVNTLTWDAGFAIRLTNALEEHGLTWIEEPFEPAALDALPPPAQPAARRSIGSGEREWDVEGYRGFIAAGVADVIGLRPGPRRGHHRRPAGDRARRGGGRLVQRPRLVERDRHRGEPRAVADDAARARLRAEAGGEPDAARARRASDRAVGRLGRGARPARASAST